MTTSLKPMNQKVNSIIDSINERNKNVTFSNENIAELIAKEAAMFNARSNSNSVNTSDKTLIGVLSVHI